MVGLWDGPLVLGQPGLVRALSVSFPTPDALTTIHAVTTKARSSAASRHLTPSGSSSSRMGAAAAAGEHVADGRQRPPWWRLYVRQAWALTRKNGLIRWGAGGTWDGEPPVHGRRQLPLAPHPQPRGSCRQPTQNPLSDPHLKPPPLQGALMAAEPCSPAAVAGGRLPHLWVVPTAVNLRLAWGRVSCPLCPSSITS